MLIYWSVGWDSDMSAILLLLHLLPPSAQGRKRPGKISASQAVDQLIRFQKVYETVFKNTFHHINLIYSLRWSDLMSFVNHQMLLLNVFCFRLEPACNNIWTTSPKAVSLIFLRRDPPEAAFTHTSLWSTSTHFHARQRGQWEPSMNSLKPITSLVRHTVLPWAAFSLLCKQTSIILTWAKQRKLPGLLNCEQECCIEWITFEIEPWGCFLCKSDHGSPSGLVKHLS